MILNLLILIKTLIYINITKIITNRILVLVITGFTSILILELIKNSKLKHKKEIRLFTYSLISIVLFADSMYYIQFGTLPSVALLKQLKLLTSVGDSIVDLLDIRLLLLLIDLPLLILLRKKLENKLTKENLIKPVASSLIVTLIIGGLTGNFKSLTRQELYLYHITDIGKTLLEDSKITNSYAKGIREEQIKDLEERTKLKKGKLTGIAKDKNIIVIQVEALQNFALNWEYEGQEVTPFLNKLLKDNSTIYYDRYYQLLGRGNTSDAEFVSHNSLHPAMSEPSYTKYGNTELYPLPKLLKEKGYHTVAMHGNDPEYWNRKEAYKTQGFDEFLSIKDYKDGEIIGMGISDRDFFKKNLEYLKELEEKEKGPFYSFMVTLTSHTPFTMPEEYLKLKIREEEKDTFLGNYVNSIHYLDQELEKFYEEFKKTDMYEDTMIVIYGDHFAIPASREEEREVVENYFNKPYNFDEMMNIPLIIHLPGEEVKETISKVGSQIDFYPTILNYLGYENEKGLMMGRDLTNYEGKNIVSPQTYILKGSFIDEDTLFVLSRDGIFENSKAYDIKTGKEKNIEEAKENYLHSIEEINLSEALLNQGILTEYIKNNGKIKLLEGEEEETKEILILKEENLKKMKNYDYIAINFQLKGDKIQPVENISMEEIKRKLKKDQKIIIRANGDEETLKKVYEEYKDLNLIGEITDFSSYITLTNNMYEKLILDPKPKKYTEEKLSNFLTTYPNLGIIENEKLDIQGDTYTYIY